MEIKNVRGGYDFLPREQNIRNYINGILKEVFEEYGYNAIETPILCYYDILADKYDEDNDILNEIYKLQDQGERRLGLRYDLTVPFAKFIALNKNKIAIPFKRYEISKVFRDGPIKVGRDREFTQCDVDVVGLSGQAVEAELMTLYVSAFKKLEIDIVIKYNSRKLMTGLILECGVRSEFVPNVTTIVDKLDKISEEDFNLSLLDLGLNSEQIAKLKEYFKLSLDELNEEFKNTENTKICEGLKELNDLTEYLKKLEIDKYCKFTSTLARGQNYYTGNVFEVYEANGFIGGSIGAGGRYDQMITDFINDGNIYPAVGVSFGLSSIYEILKNREIFDRESLIDIYVIPMQTEIESLKLANQLRNLGYRVEVDYQERKVKKSFEFANKEKIPYVIVLGEDEITNREFNLKNMNSGEQVKIKLDNLKEIQNIINK